MEAFFSVYSGYVRDLGKCRKVLEVYGGSLTP